MNKAVWRKKLAKLKRNIRNATRARMRQAVNFALADEPDIYEHPDVEVYDAEPKADIQHRIEQKYDDKKKLDAKKIFKIGLLVLGAVVIFKFGKIKGIKIGHKEMTKAFDNFLDGLIFEHKPTFVKYPHGIEYRLLAEEVTA